MAESMAEMDDLKGLYSHCGMPINSHGGYELHHRGVTAVAWILGAYASSRSSDGPEDAACCRSSETWLLYAKKGLHGVTATGELMRRGTDSLVKASERVTVWQNVLSRGTTSQTRVWRRLTYSDREPEA